MTKNKINLFINSKNYDRNNDFEISLPPSLIKCDPKKEYIVLNINGWVMKNEFYNTQESNNTFSIEILDLLNNPVEKYTYNISIGNYNVFQFLEQITPMLENHSMSISYNDRLNKYVYQNNYTEYKIKLEGDTAYDFLGLEKNKQYLIEPDSSLISENPLNMAGDELVCLLIPSIQKKYACLDDFKTGEVKQSDIIAYLSINVPPFGLLEYKNQDGGDSFSYRLENTEIDTMRLVCKNQDLENIKVGDYQLNLQFEIHNKITEMNILEQILKLVSNIFQYLLRDL